MWTLEGYYKSLSEDVQGTQYERFAGKEHEFFWSCLFLEEYWGIQCNLNLVQVVND